MSDNHSIDTSYILEPLIHNGTVITPNIIKGFGIIINLVSSKIIPHTYYEFIYHIQPHTLCPNRTHDLLNLVSQGAHIHFKAYQVKTFFNHPALSISLTFLKKPEHS